MPLSIEDIALKFAHALVAGEYDKAHNLLSLPLQRQVSPADLAEEYAAMHAYAPAPADTVESGGLLDADPPPDALGWQWVRIERWQAPDGWWSEGVALLMVNEDGRLAIGDIDWGRP